MKQAVRLERRLGILTKNKDIKHTVKKIVDLNRK